MIFPMRALVIICLAVFASVAGATTLYRWVDEDGVVHFSDKAQPGAEIVELSSAQTFTPPPVPQRAQPQEEEAPPTYDMFEIAEPVEDKVYWNLEGSFGASLRLRPSLRAGHSIYFYIDGLRIDGLSTRSLNVTLPEVFRGTHTMTASIADRTGAVLVQTDPVTFHVRQTSIQNPNNPNAPPRPTPQRPGGGGT